MVRGQSTLFRIRHHSGKFQRFGGCTFWRFFLIAYEIIFVMLDEKLLVFVKTMMYCTSKFFE